QPPEADEVEPPRTRDAGGGLRIRRYLDRDSSCGPRRGDVMLRAPRLLAIAGDVHRLRAADLAVDLPLARVRDDAGLRGAMLTAEQRRLVADDEALGARE